MKKTIDIRDRYSVELNNISNKLNQLEKGRIYDPATGNRGDGKLKTNIQQLKEMLEELIDKIEYNRKSTEEELAEEVKHVKI